MEAKLVRLTPGEIEGYLARLAPLTRVVLWNGVPVGLKEAAQRAASSALPEVRASARQSSAEGCLTSMSIRIALRIRVRCGSSCHQAASSFSSPIRLGSPVAESRCKLAP